MGSIRLDNTFLFCLFLKKEYNTTGLLIFNSFNKMTIPYFFVFLVVDGNSVVVVFCYRFFFFLFEKIQRPFFIFSFRNGPYLIVCFSIDSKYIMWFRRCK